MKNLIFRGSTSRLFWVFLPDSSSTTGAGKTGLTSASAGLNVTVRREKSTAVTTYTAAGSTTETITTLGTYAAPTASKVRFKEVDATNLPGIYEVQFADALFDTSDTSRWLSGMITATGVAPTPFELPLVAVDLQDAVRMALTALPNAVPGAPGGLFIAGSNAATSITTALTANITGNVTGNLSGSVGSVTGAVGSVTGAVGSVTGNVGGNVVGSVGSVTAGVTLAASAIQAIWDAAASALTTVSSIGKLLVDNINATISSRSSHSAADVWGVATRLLTAGTNIVLAKGVGVTGFNDLSAAQVNAEADTALTDYDAPTSAELVTEINSVQSDIAALTIPTAAAIADANWDELRAGHSVAGSYGESFFTLESGAAIAGTLSTTQMSTNLTEITDDHYLGRIVIFTSGALLRQATDITDYNGTTKVLTFTALTEAPTAADKFVIV